MKEPIQILPEGGIVVVDNVVLSAWHTAYTLPAMQALVASVDRAAAATAASHPAGLCTLGVYRFRRLRSSDLPDAETRALLAKLGNAHKYRTLVTVLDAPGIFNSTVRMFIAGLMAIVKQKAPMSIAESLDEGLGLLSAAECDLAVVEPRLRELVATVFAPPPAPPPATTTTTTTT